MEIDDACREDDRDEGDAKDSVVALVLERPSVDDVSYSAKYFLLLFFSQRNRQEQVPSTTLAAPTS